jgi:chorismate mutase-like protein
MLVAARRYLAILVLAWGCSGRGAVVAPASNATTASAGPARAANAKPVTAPVGAPLPELRIGTSGDYAPFSTRDATGAVRGFDAELAAELGQALGFEPRWVPFRWPELGERLAAGAFDVAMSGVTWQPTRAVVGYMTRALGHGGPCVLGDAAARRLAVNRGGVLETWARRRFPDRELVTVDDNTSLPSLLSSAQVGAIVTDSFERKSFERPGIGSQCEPALAQKVYWVGSARAHELGARIDGWLRGNVPRVQAAQQRWFGAPQRLDATTHLVDLLARRFAFMPLVASLKAQKNLPIEDLPREREVLADVSRGAARHGLPERAVVELFALQIELSKAVQRRQREPSSLDLGQQIRPVLSELGAGILAALAEARADRHLSEITLLDLESLSPWLSGAEREQELAALRALAN